MGRQSSLTVSPNLFLKECFFTLWSSHLFLPGIFQQYLKNRWASSLSHWQLHLYYIDISAISAFSEQTPLTPFFIKKKCFCDQILPFHQKWFLLFISLNQLPSPTYFSEPSDASQWALHILDVQKALSLF